MSTDEKTMFSCLSEGDTGHIFILVLDMTLATVPSVGRA
jgi:hypothetical protein